MAGTQRSEQTLVDGDQSARSLVVSRTGLDLVPLRQTDRVDRIEDRVYDAREFGSSRAGLSHQLLGVSRHIRVDQDDLEAVQLLQAFGYLAVSEEHGTTVRADRVVDAGRSAMEQLLAFERPLTDQFPGQVGYTERLQETAGQTDAERSGRAHTGADR